MRSKRDVVMPRSSSAALVAEMRTEMRAEMRAAMSELLPRSDGMPATVAQSPSSAVAEGGAMTLEINAENQKTVSERLFELKGLLDEGLINEEEFAAKRAKIIEAM